MWWPDYPGNNMFNSMGNLAENPEAALLFVDFDGGTALHLTGRAETAWTGHSIPGDDGGTGRRVGSPWTDTLGMPCRCTPPTSRPIVTIRPLTTPEV